MLAWVLVVGRWMCDAFVCAGWDQRKYLCTHPSTLPPPPPSPYISTCIPSSYLQRSWVGATKKQRDELLDFIRHLAEDDKEGVMAVKVRRQKGLQIYRQYPVYCCQGFGYCTFTCRKEGCLLTLESVLLPCAVPKRCAYMQSTVALISPTPLISPAPLTLLCDDFNPA